MTVDSELASFFNGGVTIFVATMDAAGMPECARAVGARAAPGSDGLTLYLPAATGGQTLANLLGTDRIAVCFSRPEDHRTLQLKGRRVTLREARPDERPIVESYVEALAGKLCFAGLPPRLTRRLSRWPAWAVELVVEELFDQTPGPGAGAALPRRA